MSVCSRGLWRPVAASIFPSTYGANAYVRIQGMGASLGDCRYELLHLWILAGVYFLFTCFIYMYEIRKSVGRTILE